MKVLIKNTVFLLLLSLCLTGATRPGSAAEQPVPEDAAACLECHSQRGAHVTFQNNESVEAYVDAAAFKRSVHAALGCSACHEEFSKDNHPKRSFRSREQYAIKSAQICRQCHPDDQLKAVPIHASLLKQGDGATACTVCHSAHTVSPTMVKGGTLSAEKQYCLGCHSHDLTMVLRNGAKKSVKVDAHALDGSVHAGLSCFDCHFGFSTTEHPKRTFRNARDFSLANSESCRRCHFDKYTKTLESIHYAVLSTGNTNAPVCTDCHGAHAVRDARADRTASAQRCGTCHSDVYKVYATSVHGKALVEEHNTDVPICSDCHTAHSIQVPTSAGYREQVPEMCGKCHANGEVMNKYGLSTGVVNSYLQDFHGVTLKLYRQQGGGAPGASKKSIATCVDCHGIHDITTTTGPTSNLVKERLKKRCAKCHPGATEEFPDAWLSHYKPSLKNAPLVFAINLMYKILIPFMIVGLVLQILLHVWRYAVSR
jgi:hypothetical protein